MKTRNLLFLVINVALILIVFGCTKPNPSVLELKNNWKIQSSSEINESGGEISKNEFQPEQWYPVSFPTTVLAGLVENDVFPDPYYGETKEIKVNFNKNDQGDDPAVLKVDGWNVK